MFPKAEPANSTALLPLEQDINSGKVRIMTSLNGIDAPFESDGMHRLGIPSDWIQD